MYSCNSRAALPDHLRSGRALWSWNFSNRDEITSKATFEWLCCYLSRPYNKASEPLIGTSYIRLLVCSEALNFFSMRYYRKTPCNSKLIPGIKNEAISAHGIAKSCNCFKKKKLLIPVAQEAALMMSLKFPEGFQKCQSFAGQLCYRRQCTNAKPKKDNLTVCCLARISQ